MKSQKMKIYFPTSIFCTKTLKIFVFIFIPSVLKKIKIVLWNNSGMSGKHVRKATLYEFVSGVCLLTMRAKALIPGTRGEVCTAADNRGFSLPHKFAAFWIWKRRCEMITAMFILPIIFNQDEEFYSNSLP